MASFDPQAGVVVIHVVYDGPPEAGKTTSIRALARSFGREVYTPEERDGRTVWFDWLEHTGGMFQGAPIHCQIASVPGQRRWTRRRGYFLERADAVVFVGDTTAARWPESLARLQELRATLDARAGAPVAVVLQANKRDRADAVSLAEVRRTVERLGAGVVEATAHDGGGVREAFVFGVRLALDRVRLLQEAGALPGVPAQVGGEALLGLLRGLDAAETPVEPPAGDTPPPPGRDVPSGHVWPPIDGRIRLREATAEPLRVRITSAGDCVAGLATGWRIHSAAEDVFTDLERARQRLVAWARQHVAAGALLSRERCLVLDGAGAGRWRLWQVVRPAPCLRELLEEPSGHDRQALARRVLRRAEAACASAGVRWPCTLDTIGIGEDEAPLYVGMVPPLGDEVSAAGEVA